MGLLTSIRIGGRRGRPIVDGSRIGLFGLLGSGNLGNDASFEVVLSYLSAHHPDAVLDAMCMGPEQLSDRYGIDAVPLLWCRRYEERATGVAMTALKMLGKGVDAYRTASWVRRHDIVIVPGMGILEASLPLRASGTPYALFLLCASGRLFATKVALVSVGASPVDQRMIRWLHNAAARLASYRSYRDVPSRDIMRQRGIDTTHDHVCPDLVFGIHAPPSGPGDPRTVGVGVMTYRGANEDRRHAAGIYSRYIEAMTRFIRWLLDTDHRVRLFWGDDVDGVAVHDIMSGLRSMQPELGPSSVVAEPFHSLRDLMQEMALAGTVVGTRYHTVLGALKLSKPTISIGYSAKHDALMAGMGLSEFTHSARSVDVDLLIEQFTDLERRSTEVRQTLVVRIKEKEQALDDQFALLAPWLSPTERSGWTGGYAMECTGRSRP